MVHWNIGCYIVMTNPKTRTKTNTKTSAAKTSSSKMPGASNTRRKLGRGQCGRNLREDWDESCLHGTQWVQMEQCFKVNVLKSGFSITNYHITVPTTQVCDNRTQRGLWGYYRLRKHFKQGKNLKITVVELGEFFLLQRTTKVSIFHRHIDSIS